MPRSTPPPADYQSRYKERFHAAASPAELLALAKEMQRDHPGDPYCMTLASMIGTALAMEAPELLDEL